MWYYHLPAARDRVLARVVQRGRRAAALEGAELRPHRGELGGPAQSGVSLVGRAEAVWWR
jgi:hypothetical protein